jgi:hypothetical protein
MRVGVAEEVGVHLVAEARLFATPTNHLLEPRLSECTLAGNPKSRARSLTMPSAEAQIAVKGLRRLRPKAYGALASPLPHHADHILVKVEIVLQRVTRVIPQLGNL